MHYFVWREGSGSLRAPILVEAQGVVDAVEKASTKLKGGTLGEFVAVNVMDCVRVSRRRREQPVDSITENYRVPLPHEDDEEED